MQEKKQKHDNYKVAVCIPCKDEELTIADTIYNIKEDLPDATIYVYDNNSTDNTFNVANECGVVVGVERKPGKGSVVKRMIKDIEADCYILIDGDNTYDTSQLERMVRMVKEKGKDMVLGYRKAMYDSRSSGFIHTMGNRLVNVLVYRLFGQKNYDVMTGLRVMNRNTARLFKSVSDGFEIETEMAIIAAKNRLNLGFVPIMYFDRINGSKSKLHPLRDGSRILMTLIKAKVAGR